MDLLMEVSRFICFLCLEWDGFQMFRFEMSLEAFVGEEGNRGKESFPFRLDSSTVDTGSSNLLFADYAI